MAEERKICDAVVVGGGPAGLTAGIYLARAGFSVLIVERDRFGGQILTTSTVANYPGAPSVSGEELASSMMRQAQSFGAEFMIAEVTKIDMSGRRKIVSTSRGEISCVGVILATGARPRECGFEGETEFRGRGVAYCAVCDGEFFTGRDVFVVGGGVQAAEESVFLTRYARHVTVLIRGGGFSCPRVAADAALSHPKITVRTHTEIAKVEGSSRPERMTLRDTKSGETEQYAPADGGSFGIFVLAGRVPETTLAESLVELSQDGFIVTDGRQRTSLEGLYAAGDVCEKGLRQVVTAVGDGAVAATEIERYIEANLAPDEVAPKRSAYAPRIASECVPLLGEAPRAEIFDDEIRGQLVQTFDKMRDAVELRLYLDESDASRELRAYAEELASMTDKISIRDDDAEAEVVHRPCVRVYRADGSWSGAGFHGVPGGHEFTPFVLALYNASGEGQSIDGGLASRIRSIDDARRVKIFVTLSCTMCPELVSSAQRIAALNPEITAEAYDMNLFPDLREKFSVMSVPCIVINDQIVGFGKKNIPQMIELLGA